MKKCKKCTKKMRKSRKHVKTETISTNSEKGVLQKDWYGTRLLLRRK